MIGVGLNVVGVVVANLRRNPQMDAEPGGGSLTDYLILIGGIIGFLLVMSVIQSVIEWVLGISIREGKRGGRKK
tara:strand:- start:1554 stop:1775 length:222 start_codon:yes stop_codon:yes gene_type:complete